MLTEDEKTLIRESFMQVAIAGKDATDIFYETLFEMDPSTEPLFARVNMAEQGRKLIETLGALVASMERLDEVVPDIVDLARRHVAYGVTYEQYVSVRDALVTTMKNGLPDFSAEAEAAWDNLFELILPLVRDVYE